MEGILKLKQNDNGNRHYIELPNGKHDDIYCGEVLEVQMCKWVEVRNGEELRPEQWMQGRYEADLCCDNPKAFLYIGYFYPSGDGMRCLLPLGTKVRRPKER